MVHFGGIAMSQRGTPLVIGGAIIVAGTLVALAIVFAPQLSGLWRQADPKDSKDDRSTAKSDSPNEPPVNQKTKDSTRPETAYLSVSIDKPNYGTSDVSGWFFIDGKFRGKLPIRDSFQLRPTEHRLRCVVIDNSAMSSIAGDILLVPGETKSFSLSVRSFDFLAFDPMPQSDEMSRNGLRVSKQKKILYRVRAATESEDVWRSYVTEGLTEFSNYDLWKAISGGVDPNRITTRREWVNFPEYLGGLREVDAEEMQILRGILLRAFDEMLGFNAQFGLRLWSSKPNAYLAELELNVRENRKNVEDRLDRIIRALVSAPDR